MFVNGCAASFIETSTVSLGGRVLWLTVFNLVVCSDATDIPLWPHLATVNQAVRRNRLLETEYIFVTSLSFIIRGQPVTHVSSLCICAVRRAPARTHRHQVLYCLNCFAAANKVWFLPLTRLPHRIYNQLALGSLAIIIKKKQA
jgi:hypothetical protein